MASDSKSHSDSFGDSSTPTFGADLAAAKKSPTMEGDDVYMTGTKNNEANELGNVKKRSQETEDESAGFQELEDKGTALREIQANVEKEMDPLHGIAFGESSTCHINKKPKVAPSVFGQASASFVREQNPERTDFKQGFYGPVDEPQEGVFGSGVGLGLKTMAEETDKPNDTQQAFLNPFFQRASAAKDRLAKLEAALASEKDSSDEELRKTNSELQSKLEDANAEVVVERKKAEKLAVENEKLKYRVKHLIGAVEAANLKLQSMSLRCDSDDLEVGRESMSE